MRASEWVCEPYGVCVCACARADRGFIWSVSSHDFSCCFTGCCYAVFFHNVSASFCKEMNVKKGF